MKTVSNSNPFTNLTGTRNIPDLVKSAKVSFISSTVTPASARCFFTFSIGISCAHIIPIDFWLSLRILLIVWPNYVSICFSSVKVFSIGASPLR